MLHKFKYMLKNKWYRGEKDEFDIDMEQLKNMEKYGVILIDVRSPQEYNEGHLNGAILLPEYELLKKAPDEIKDKNAKIVIYCTTGNRSKKAQRMLQDLGYKNVYNLYKGIESY